MDSETVTLDEGYIAHTYGRQPITIIEGEGMVVRDVEGKEYLDFVGGIAVCGLGHSNPEIVSVLNEQAKRLMHISNLYYISPQARLAERLAKVTPKAIEKFFFCNSGAEAVEAALKLAVRHTGRVDILALEGSFHGRTCGALGATWEKSYRKPYKSLISPVFDFAPVGDLDAVKEKVNDQTAAIVAEPIQGEGGINVLSKHFIRGLREVCDDNGSLLILDEIQSGMCRTGKWFACEHSDVQPDVITIAKSLGNGFPIGAMGAKKEIMDSFAPGDHASTFGGNPLGSAVAKKVIDIMNRDEMFARAGEIGGYFKEKLEWLLKRHDVAQEVRGRGLMLALELEGKDIAEKVLERAREDGFLINVTQKNVLRFLPPLIVEKKQIDKLIEKLDEILGEEVK